MINGDYMKKVLILGSSGSIGQNALNVIRKFPYDFEVSGLAVNKSIGLLNEQAQTFGPKSVYIADVESVKDFYELGEHKDLKIYTGEDGLCDIVRETDYDLLLNALVGSVGFLPTLEAVKRGKNIALANKETLVMGGEIIMPLAKENEVEIIPVDSEHSAIFQILRHFTNVDIHKMILTASGGPFFNQDKSELSNVSVKDALAHPTWSMGSKISIDSATMMNKGLEVIEAQHLFGIEYEKIQIVIHPQSLVHSLVEFSNGEMYAQMGPTDMCFPIQNALTYPAIRETPFERLDLSKSTEMNFYPHDPDSFPMPALAYKYGKEGGIMPTVLNSSNEICVYAFLDNQISFLDIPRIVEEVCGSFENKETTVENLIKADKEARAKAREYVSGSAYGK